MSDVFTIPKPPHGSSAWLAARWADENGDRLVPASSAAAMFGEHDYITPGELAAVMLAPNPPEETEATEAQDRGTRLEPVIAEWWADRHGDHVAEPAVLYRRGRCVATIDRTIYGHTDRHLEIKTTNKFWSGELPRMWAWQGVAQSYCRGTSRVEWAILDGRLRLHDHTQHVTDEQLTALENRVAWWCSFIDMGMVPEGVEFTYHDATVMHPVATIAKADLGHGILAAVGELRAARADQKAAALREANAKAVLALALGDAEIGLVDGTEVVSWKSSVRTSLDGKALKRDLPDVWAQYSRHTPMRTMRVIGEKDGNDGD